MVEVVLEKYGLEDHSVNIKPFGTGLINNTWKVEAANEQFILQRINDQVFKHPHDIAGNIRMIGDFLRSHHPEYLFISPHRTLDGQEMVYEEGNGYYRMFPFVAGSHSIDVVETPEQAFQAAQQFGRFTRLLNGLDVSRLNITIPGFHDLPSRYRDFLSAIDRGNRKRITDSAGLIKQIIRYVDIVAEFDRLKPLLPLRVTHHDTKISNILFDAYGNGLCVIDLDTVMPGYFISDVGDMMRTYLSPVSEEENDFSQIRIRDDFYKSIVSGYMSEMENELNHTEKECFLYAGKFLIYLQAIRFLTDHLNDDVYYGADYTNHNFMRAKNQMTLLDRLVEKEDVLMSLT